MTLQRGKSRDDGVDAKTAAAREYAARGRSTPPDVLERERDWVRRNLPELTDVDTGVYAARAIRHKYGVAAVTPITVRARALAIILRRAGEGAPAVPGEPTADATDTLPTPPDAEAA